MQNNNITQRLSFIFMLLFVLFHIPVQAQYFGRNKPSYKSFNYKVYETPHFDLYYYVRNDSVLRRLGQMCEQWYKLHQVLFRDTFKTRNPVIIYNNQADFQQTTAIPGLISVGTGGVTEALKDRVVIPIAPSYAQTEHVLGHELVHAFQYHVLVNGDISKLNNLKYLPLWMVEGMAEYFSLGSVDEPTAMWMRDAIVNGHFPTIDEMTRSNRYFPYRYGQCLWAMIGKTWGDSIIVPIMNETVKGGYKKALEKKLGYNSDLLSKMWKDALVKHYEKYIDIALTKPSGRKILFSQNAGDMNISPSISPDGNYVIFLSEKDIFTFDLYLADAHTGQIIRKLSSTVQNSEIDAFNYIESAGTWSPDGKQFAFTVFENGINKLAIVDVKKGKIKTILKIPGVPAFNNPAWSPSGKVIALSGLVQGQTDLYTYNLKTKEVKQITNDAFSYLQPSWSKDGKYLTFSTDYPLKKGGSIDPGGGMHFGIMNLATKKIRLFPVFTGAKNLNPLFSPDDHSIFFLSDRDGFRNLYRYSLDSATTYQLTKYFTGISGITEYSPAISIARNTETLTYSYYYDGKYSIYAASIHDFKPWKVQPDSLNFDAATLPPILKNTNDVVDKDLAQRPKLKFELPDSFKFKSYKPKFKLDYVSNLDVGVGASRFGAGMAGSIFAMYSDMVGQNQLYTSLAVNGEIYDFAGVVAYMNAKHRINWGASLSHIPYLYASQGAEKDTLTLNNVRTPVDNYPIYVERVFEDKASLFAYKAFSETKRIEAGISSSWNYYRVEVYNYYFKSNGDLVQSNMQVAPVPHGYLLHSVDAAYVTDNSFFGMTGPMRGHRSRIGLEDYFGGINYFTVLLDYRKYFYIKPYTIAIRGLHFGRYGHGAEDNRIPSLYLGYPWYIRGYDVNTFKNVSASDTANLSINNLAGSRIALANVEFRFPFTGPKRICLIKSDYLLSDLVCFFDAGLAWQNGSKPVLKWKPQTPEERTPLLSSGFSIRINVLGYMVIEPYYAFPLQYGGLKNPIFGINFVPGW